MSDCKYDPQELVRQIEAWRTLLNWSVISPYEYMEEVNRVRVLAGLRAIKNLASDTLQL